MLLVLNARGAARAFRVMGDPSMLDEVSPLDVLNFDILVYGNNQETVDKLSAHLPTLFHE